MIKNVTKKIILASKSPRRKQLLKQIDFDFEVVPSQIDEDLNLDLKPFLFVEHYANLKAQNVANKYQNRWVIGADTVVVFNDKILMLIVPAPILVTVAPVPITIVCPNLT